MLKKFLALAAAAAMALTLTACGGTGASLPVLNVPDDSASAVSQAAPDSAKFDDDLAGLCKYLEEAGAVLQDGTENSFTEMSYKEIGAIGGCRYRFTYNGSTVQAEFYEFDLDHLDEKGKACLAEAKEKGQITVLENQVPVTLHSNGRYLMIYTDTKDNEANRAHSELVKELFLGFHA